MKRFNLFVVVAWLTIFFCSLRSNSVYPADVEKEPFGIGWLMDNTNYQINTFAWTNCEWCAKPNEQVRVETGVDENNQPQYVMQDDYGNLADNRMTLTILQNTFLLLLVFMFAINFAFYCGNGTVGRGARTAMMMTAAYGGKLRTMVTSRIGRKEKSGIAPPNETQIIELN